MTTTTIAQKVSELFNDGQTFTAHDGRGFKDVCEAHGARVEYGVRVYRDDVEHASYWVKGYSGDHFSGDPVRYVFDDGSALVERGEAWDIEGDEPFSWAM